MLPHQSETNHQPLYELISDKINHSNTDSISFAEFMQLALYAPHYGYYTAKQQKFGKHGDFVTAPEMTPLFGQCLARQCQQVIEHIPNSVILELGAGTGQLACDILLALEQKQCLPQTYYILELSPDLKQRQVEAINQQCPQLMSRIQWINTLDNIDIKGIIIANEVIDAMPIHRFTIEEQCIREICVGIAKDGQFKFTQEPIKTPSLLSFIQQLQQHELANVSHYQSEVNLLVKPWIEALAKTLQEGVMMFIDYGFPRREFYHSCRSTGTLMCHYQHKSHTNPLVHLGAQDITSHVDFTRIAEAADDAELQVSGYTSQASFLISCGLLELSKTAISDEKSRFAFNTAIKQLTLPSEMGELFKVIALQKKCDLSLLGFDWHNQLHQL